MKTLIILLIAILPVSLDSQEIFKADSSILKKGIYKNLEELKFNSPSLPLTFTIEKETNNNGFLGSGVEHISYQLSISENEFSNLGFFIGFCDGHYIYINPDPINLKRKTNFERLEIVGPLSYFEMFVLSKGKSGGASLRPFVIDIPMGNISILSSDLMKEVLSADTALLSQFTLEEKKMNLVEKYTLANELAYKNYLAKYYTRNIECKTSLRNNMGVFGLVNYIKEKSTDTSYQVYYNRVMSLLKVNPYFDNVTLFRKDYSNGNCKQIGILAYQGTVPFYIGVWLYFDSSGKRIRVKEYDLNASKIRDEEY